MFPFRVGDTFYDNRNSMFADVTWVDPRDHFRARVTVSKNGVIERANEEVVATEFRKRWTLFRMGPATARTAV